jgi:uncharacterized membrane protein
MNRYSDSLRLVVSMGDGYWLGWIIGFILLIAIIVLAIKIMNKKSKLNRLDITALDILKDRYNADEITKAEFEEKKKNLK